MIKFLLAYQPVLDLVLLNSGLALSQYAVLRAGIFSIATAGFASIGAYTAAITLKSTGLGFPIALVIAVILGAVIGLGLAVILARVRGAYQAICTLAFVQIVAAHALWNEPLTGGALGISGIQRNIGTLGLFIAVTLVVVFLMVMEANRIGRTFDAIKQDEFVAKSLGIAVFRFHALAFALSGAIGSLFGAFFAGYLYSVDPSQFGFPLLATTLAFVVLGGRKSPIGPILGAIILTAVPEIFRPLAEYRMVIVGGFLIMIITFFPEGLAAAVLQRSGKTNVKPSEQPSLPSSKQS